MFHWLKREYKVKFYWYDITVTFGITDYMYERIKLECVSTRMSEWENKCVCMCVFDGEIFFDAPSICIP